ncbi:protein O-linked-mannose beta-1,4-N-acetylglucosaminyltransferase 2-like [Ananas comosus]|uniref:Protein O-linked-mannose beta-1,4-N-acetylglucosaminyltransferase 2-like n=1 Tax=Ananas comosus TaxID=4615 RepID=A0A6P5F3S9_ANACO|nr:protein O-linked-mannose beta-1,4-N-acetylglucosaminyltransferase 2-like [Ananas comosus]
MTKSLARSLSKSHVGAGFLVGFFLVLLAYFTVSEQFAIRALNLFSQRSTEHEVVSTPSAKDVEQGRGAEKSNQLVELKPICDTSNPDFCDITGDTRILGSNSTVFYVPPPKITNPEPQEWKTRVRTHKHLKLIEFVTIKSLRGPSEAPPCTVRHDVPAVVFELSVQIGNIWHDFNNVIIPLYLTSRRFNGEVQFLITNLKPWFLKKYSVILKKLSRYEIIDFSSDKEIRCYPRALVGLRRHRDFGILPNLPPKGYTMLDFRLFIREAYSLPKDVPISYRDKPEKKPRLMLINRGETRRLLNIEEVVKSAEELGFEVVVVEPKRDLNVTEIAKVVDSFDALMGVHGAGLANIVFLRTNAAMIQVVPYGKLEPIAESCYGWPAREMKLRDVEYTISLEESTLLERLGRDHPAIKDPDSIHRSGLKKVREFYKLNQDVKLNVTRFAPTLLKALELLHK